LSARPTTPAKFGTVPTAAAHAATVAGWSRKRSLRRQNDFFVGNHAGEFNNRGHTMNWDMIQGDWKQFKGHVKEKWGKLTDDSLTTIAGRRDQLAGQIQATYGITKDQAEVQVKAFEALHKDYQPGNSA
jgi:uncharacterized protein YjbJ (UPF0337 family)